MSTYTQNTNVLMNEKTPTHKMHYLLNEKTPFSIMEAFRNIKAALSVSVPKSANKGTVIMMTSPLPEDGKTTVSVNLALMFALSDAKVVVVDADIRKGRVGKYFKQKNEPGLSNYLSGQVSAKRMTYRSKINENLFFITCGTYSPRPYELLESAEMGTLIEELRSEFDYVIIDTPPILLVSDPLAFANIIDGTVLIARYQKSNMNDIGKALRSLAFAKANVLGVVVNDYKGVPTKDGYGYYDDYYSYGENQPYALNVSAKKATSANSKLKKAEEKVEEIEESEE